MHTRVTWVVALALFGTWALAGCAGKKPATASGVGETTVTDSGSGVAESGAGGAAGAGASGFQMPTVYFDFNQYSIRSEDREKLTTAADHLKKSADIKITIEGHCDERGSSEYNLALGERRAVSIKGYLQKLGVAADRLATLSYGEERPVDTASTEAAWAKNRRGEMISNQ